jgi:hypothetical protein
VDHPQAEPQDNELDHITSDEGNAPTKGGMFEEYPPGKRWFVGM